MYIEIVAWLFEDALCSVTSLSIKTSRRLILVTPVCPVVTKCFGCFSLMLAGWWGSWMQPVTYRKYSEPNNVPRQKIVSSSVLNQIHGLTWKMKDMKNRTKH